MRRVSVAVIVLAVMMASSGCALRTGTSKTAIRHFDRDGVDMIAEPLTGQATLFVPTPGLPERFCRTPGADAVITVSEGISMPLLAGRSIGEDAARGAVALGGRDAAVLITRELLYRACELSVNLRADPELSVKIYERFLATVELIGKLQSGLGTSPTSATPTATIPGPATSTPTPTTTPATTSP